MWILALMGAGAVSALVHLFVIGFDGGAGVICSVILLHQYVVTFGLIGIVGFYINVIKAEKTAKNLGWPGGPFQWKYGFSQLGMGAMGVMSIWFRGQFWLGTLVSMYVYGVSGLWSHSAELLRKRKVDKDRKSKADKADKVEIANIVLDVLYQVALTVLLLHVPEVWN